MTTDASKETTALVDRPAASPDPLTQVLGEWLVTCERPDRELTSEQLWWELRACAHVSGLPFDLSHPVTMDAELKKRWSELQRLYRATARRAGARITYYSFRLTDEVSQ